MWTVIGSLAGVGLSLWTLYKSLLELDRFNRRMEAERKALAEKQKRENR